MALTPGSRLGVYDITAQIGEGGMGQVYRARDTKLDRDVAIKILPEAFSQDADRLARFTREAKTLASLNHPNIAAIYGLEEGGGASALVMELVEGEDLSRKLEGLRAKGSGLPLDEALPIAKQIADALEAAHEQGIVHRDLKPANIKVRADGTVKILDFGLAKAMDPVAQAFRPAGGAGSVSMSPTMMSPAQLSGVGVILGTAAYMAPEQARGRAVDKRADIWAFGVVLYEILTGTRLFAGDSVPETLGLIFSREPDLALLPASTPSRVRTLIARCLVKNPRQRLRDIGDARLELEDPRETPAPSASAPARSIWRALPWTVAAAAVLVAGWALWGRTGVAPASRDVTQLDLGFPRDVEPVTVVNPPVISPDGQTVAMVGVKDGVRRLFVRRFDRADATEVPGFGGVSFAEFSPDSGSVAVLATTGAITRVSLSDQQRKVVTSGADLTGGLAWSPAGIVFSRGGALWIVSPEGGGTPRVLTTLDATRHEVLHDHQVVLPGQRFVLFASQTTEPGAERIEAVAIDGGQRTVVVERATTPVWSSTGHLLFARDGAVLAVAFDPRTATMKGTAVVVAVSGAAEALASGGLALSLSATGTLVYVPAGFTDARVHSVARDGAALALAALPSGMYANPRISPDGLRLLVEIGGNVIEAVDLARGTRARLTAGALITTFSTWSADGNRVVFKRFGSPFWAAVDGSSNGPVPGGTVNDFPSSPGPDPDSILVVRNQPGTTGDIFLMSSSGAFEPKPLIVTPAFEGGPQLSPDRRWMLYQTDASGRAEIYVRRYPALDRQWQVSEGGALQARWSRNGKEIYYRSAHRIVAVAFDGAGVEPVFGKPTPLFADDYEFGQGASIANYDVTPDGRFIMIRRGSNGGKLRVVVNWTEELKRILASGGVR